MMGANKVVIAAAGSGKTTFLVKQALGVNDGNVLIITYTESNEAEIRRKFFELNGGVPKNVVVSTWFSFLIAHGIRPFQGGLFDFPVMGMTLVDKPSGLKFVNKGIPVRWGEEENFRRHYFDTKDKVYSDKLSKLVVRCDKHSDGSVIDRISRIYAKVFIDEVQDLAGYDLEIIRRLFESRSEVILVGDPRQVTYLTHNEQKYTKYSEGGIREFLGAELPKKIKFEIDDKTLGVSHRNSAAICGVSSRLYPKFAATIACDCAVCRPGIDLTPGLFIVRAADKAKYLDQYRPVQLRYNVTSKGPDVRFPALNFGESKGLGFDHVIIFPTDDMAAWMKNNTTKLAPQTRAKMYVAMTRARHSVAVAFDFKDDEIMDGFALYE
jgi:hypothetical protein